MVINISMGPVHETVSVMASPVYMCEYMREGRYEDTIGRYKEDSNLQFGPVRRVFPWDSAVPSISQLAAAYLQL